MTAIYIELNFVARVCLSELVRRHPGALPPDLEQVLIAADYAVLGEHTVAQLSDAIPEWIPALRAIGGCALVTA